MPKTWTTEDKRRMVESVDGRAPGVSLIKAAAAAGGAVSQYYTFKRELSAGPIKARPSTTRKTRTASTSTKSTAQRTATSSKKYEERMSQIGRAVDAVLSLRDDQIDSVIEAVEQYRQKRSAPRTSKTARRTPEAITANGTHAKVRAQPTA